VLTVDDAGALLAPLTGASGVLIAVSGGPDSVALLGLAARWRAASPAAPPIFAATVDHRLRTEARAEAELVAALAARCGIPHAILNWEGGKPRAGLQEAAREARYDLLAQEARRCGADVLATAHHADDQAETILMRLLRGSGVGGLAGMRPQTRRLGLRLVRPLLGLRKAELVDFCAREGLSFATDPSNADPRFARARLRRLCALLEGEGLAPEHWARLARRAARAEDALRAQADALAAAAVLDRGEGRVVLSMTALAAAPEEACLRLIGAEAARAGEGKPPRLERAEAALSRLLHAHAAGEAFAGTLAGALIRLTGRGALTIERAPPRRGRAQGRAQESAQEGAQEDPLAATSSHLVHPLDEEGPSEGPRAGASLGKGAVRA
jgi:tRNA(Ile)-lysidine synthase